MRFAHTLACVSLMAFALPANAEPITYYVNRAAGAYTVTGSITTDGTLGALWYPGGETEVFTTFELHFAQDGVEYAVVTPENGRLVSNGVAGSLVRATATELRFQAFAESGDFFIASDGGPTHWSMRPPICLCPTPGQPPYLPWSEKIGGGVVVRNAADGDIAFAFVPEPSSAALLLLGLSVLMARARARNA